MWPESSEKFREWMAHTTKFSPKEGGYRLRDYQRFFGFKLTDLQKSNILDLGSGERELFSADIKAKKLKAKVINLNPDYALDRLLRIENTSEHFDNKDSLAGLGQELPFRDNQFEFVFALLSVSRHSGPHKNPEGAEAWSKEAYRVLKPNGKFGIVHGFDITGRYDEDYKQYVNEFDEIKRLLTRAGFRNISIDRLKGSGPNFTLRIIATK